MSSLDPSLLPAGEGTPFDLAADRQSAVQALAHSPEVEALTARIDVGDPETIVTFGADAAREIARSSDTVLKSARLGAMEDAGALMQDLARIMDQVDLDEIKKEPTLLDRLKGGKSRKLEQTLTKYHSLGGEVDKIYVRLRQYEEEIKRSNQDLEALFRANLHDYHELIKYIVAGEQGCREIADYLSERRQALAEGGDPAIRFEIQSLEQALSLLQQRTYDLRIAEAVAMQSIPMLKIMQYNNMNLVSKIEAAFIVTLPVFRQALAQAILLKRQRIQADALNALDARTGKMLAQNARNAAEQSRLSSGTGAIQTDALKDACRTILQGIRETQSLQRDAEQRQAQERSRLESLRRDYARRCGAAPAQGDSDEITLKH